VRRFSGGSQRAPREPDGLAPAQLEGSPYARAAGLAHFLLSRRIFADAPLTTALLAMCAQLALEGLQLLAPQGAIVGMITELSRGEVDAATVTRWLEDRSVPASPAT
jgi:prophage maintenance system killer protein